MKLNLNIRTIWTFPFLCLIRFYQYAISPIIGPACRYTPSCSQYLTEAIKRHGLKGFWMGAKRMGTCHPWGGHGYDPVPKSGKHN